LFPSLPHPIVIHEIFPLLDHETIRKQVLSDLTIVRAEALKALSEYSSGL
jgi:hypothetical protein